MWEGEGWYKKGRETERECEERGWAGAIATETGGETIEAGEVDTEIIIGTVGGETIAAGEVDTGTIVGIEGTIGEAKGVKRLLEETTLEHAEEDVGNRWGEVAQGTTLGQTREASEAREGIVLELVLVLEADVGAEGTKEGVEIESNFRERRERLHSKADSLQVREDKVAEEDLMQKGHTKG